LVLANFNQLTIISCLRLGFSEQLKAMVAG
jgi:hypothetical protein